MLSCTHHSADLFFFPFFFSFLFCSFLSSIYRVTSVHTATKFLLALKISSIMSNKYIKSSETFSAKHVASRSRENITRLDIRSNTTKILMPLQHSRHRWGKKRQLSDDLPSFPPLKKGLNTRKKKEKRLLDHLSPDEKKNTKNTGMLSKLIRARVKFSLCTLCFGILRLIHLTGMTNFWNFFMNKTNVSKLTLLVHFSSNTNSLVTCLSFTRRQITIVLCNHHA